MFVWWIGFSQITFSRLPKYTFRQRIQRDSVWTNGYRELRVVFNHIRKSARLSLYLTGFFFLMMGVLTTIFMAATYGEKQLGLKEDVLIPTILAIQLVGMLGAWMFARISEKLGNLQALMITIVGWTFICIGAYYITDAIQFFFIGLVMGGSQSLARSTYSKMLPADTTDHTSFFSFYDVMEFLIVLSWFFLLPESYLRGTTEWIADINKYSFSSLSVLS